MNQDKGKKPASPRLGLSRKEILAKKASLPLLESVEQYKDVRNMTSKAVASLARQTIRFSMTCKCSPETSDAATTALERVKTLQELYIALLVCMDDVLVKGKVLLSPDAVGIEPVEVECGIFPILEEANEE